ncbi:HIT family protein [Arenibaculum sp.]|uniref:HIT family protein n=1 Tax=Arenibaculum sp. TaxID=2865862 RepID=UPI002E156CEF|nr:HIT family protein [Arenibaculum sp.]
MFVLNERLAADTVTIGALALCRVLMMANRAWPWLVLVPQRPGIREIHELGREDRALLVEEVAQASLAMERLHAPDKLNVGALGNVVPQLHLHVVARRVGDPAWPGPVWGSGVHEPFPPEALAAEAARFAAALGLAPPA